MRVYLVVFFVVVFCFQAEDGIRDLVRSRGLGDVYKRHNPDRGLLQYTNGSKTVPEVGDLVVLDGWKGNPYGHVAIISAVEDGDCLLYTSDAADERSSVDLGGRRIIKKK